MRLLCDEPIDDTAPRGTLFVIDLRDGVALADALRALVTEHRLRGVITGAYLATARCRTWEGLDCARYPGESHVRMNGRCECILPAVAPIEPDERADLAVVMREFCALNPQFTAFEGYTLRGRGDGGATLRASCWAAADRHSDLVDLVHGHRGVPAGWAYLGVRVCWSPGRANSTCSRPEHLDDLALSARTRNRLGAAGIASVDDLLTCSHADLGRVPGIGMIAVREIDAALAAHGLFLPWRDMPPLFPAHQVSDQERSEPLQALELPAKVLARLAAGGITTVGDILDMTKADLLRIQGIGEGATRTIRGKLDDRGLALKAYERSRTPMLPRRDPSVTIDALFHAGLVTLRPRRALLDAGIDTVGKLVRVTERDLLGLPGVGPASVARIQEGVERLGFKLGQGAEHE